MAVSCMNLLKNIQPLKRSHILCQYRYASSSTFKASDLQVQLTNAPKPKPSDPDTLPFGHSFSDHMLEISWSADKGWGKPLISPLHNLSLHPGAKCFHYATELFEGMKAYKTAEGKINLFRPTENMARMLSSAKRASLPTFDGDELIKCIKKLISIDRDWVPNSEKASLYIRPTLIGTEGVLRVDTSHEALLFVLIGPVGAYYPTGLKPVSLLADPKYVRAWPGGSGSFKLGCNYAPTMSIQQEAASKGCQQVLWLFGQEEQITEVGAMNLFMYWTNENGEDELVTCPLNGLVLPGITRKSLLELAKSWGEFKVSEREYTMQDLIKGLKENRVKEFFGAGTACVVCPVEKVLYRSQWLNIPTMSQGAPLTMRMYKTLLDIQYGRVKHEWSVPVE